MASICCSISFPVPPNSQSCYPNKNHFTHVNRLSEHFCCIRTFQTLKTLATTHPSAQGQLADEGSMSVDSLHRFIQLNLGDWNGSFHQFDANGNLMNKVSTKLAASSYGEDDLMSLIQTSGLASGNRDSLVLFFRSWHPEKLHKAIAAERRQTSRIYRERHNLIQEGGDGLGKFNLLIWAPIRVISITIVVEPFGKVGGVGEELETFWFCSLEENGLDRSDVVVLAKLGILLCKILVKITEFCGETKRLNRLEECDVRAAVVTWRFQAWWQT
ncbi:hypothetical protein Ancab_005701 [Ancistrocladus abbreviatus]